MSTHHTTSRRSTKLRIGGLLAIAALALTALAPATARADHGSDAAASANHLFGFDAQSTAGFTTETGEPLTCDGAPYGATAWYRVTGSGRPMTITTAGSDFDTVLAVYRDVGGLPAEGDRVDCLDDDDPGVIRTTTVTFDTELFATYLVQVGGYEGATGNLTVEATREPPPNDDRAAAESVSAASAGIERDNLDATLEPGEPSSCGEAPLGSTVWFRFAVTQPGRATFRTGTPTGGGIDTVLSLYRESSSTSLACSDDAVSRNARIDIDLEPGTYFLQIGGYAGEQGVFTFDVTFVPAPVVNDRDGDGVVDSQDRCPSVRPSGPSLNGCPDADGDRVPDIVDDRCPSDNVTARGRIDVNGDGCSDLRSELEFRWKSRQKCVLRSGRYRCAKMIRFSRLTITGALARATVTMRCLGPRRGGRRKSCGRRRGVVGASGKESVLTRRLRQGLSPGSIVEVRVTKRNAVGQLHTMKITRRGPRSGERRIR